MDTLGISDKALAAAKSAFDAKLAWCHRNSIDPRLEDGMALQSALEAAAPYITAQALESAANYLDAEAAQSNYPQEELETLAQKDAASWLRARANGAAK